MQKGKLIKIGVVVIATFLVAVWGINFLKGRDVLGLESVYYVEYSNVSGLTKSSSVNFNGYKIGYVSNILFDGTNRDGLVVALSITEDFPLPTGTVAKIVSLDLLGTKGINIVLSDANTFYVEGDKLVGDIEPDLLKEINKELLPIKESAQNAIARLDTVLGSVSRILDYDSEQNLKGSIKEFHATMGRLNKTVSSMNKILEENQNGIGDIVANMQNISDTLSNNSQYIGSTLRNLSSLSDSLAASNIPGLVNNLDGILSKINRGEGNVGKLFEDEEVYNNLVTTVADLDNLINQITNSPGRYIKFSAFDFGKPRYIIAPEEMPVVDGLTYKVKYESIENIGNILYSSEFNQLDKALAWQKTNSKLISQSTVVAYKNGKEIKLDKAIKLATKESSSY